MNNTTTYRFIFRTGSGETCEVKHDCRPGDAENCARKMARLVGKKLKEEEVICIWAKPADWKVPPELTMEVRAS